MATQVQAYKSKDGVLFESQSACQAHEDKTAFFEDYWDDKLYGNIALSYVEPEDLLEYVSKHWDRFKSILDK